MKKQSHFSVFSSTTNTSLLCFVNSKLPRLFFPADNIAVTPAVCPCCRPGLCPDAAAAFGSLSSLFLFFYLLPWFQPAELSLSLIPLGKTNTSETFSSNLSYKTKLRLIVQVKLCYFYVTDTFVLVQSTFFFCIVRLKTCILYFFIPFIPPYVDNNMPLLLFY